jgi:RNA recognition motif-containing protein
MLAWCCLQGLGYVVFDEADKADEALLEMDGTDISGKEIKVNRAPSVYTLDPKL